MMIRLTDLRTRFIAVFTLLAVMVSGVNALLVFIMEQSMAEEFFERRINAELEYFSERYLLNKHTPLPTADDIRAYLGRESLPDFLKVLVKQLPDGVYNRDMDDERERGDSVFHAWKVNRDDAPREFWKTEDVFFGVRTLDDGKKVYIFIDFAFWMKAEHEARAHAFWTWLGITLLAIIVGFIVANQMIGPLNRLMAIIRKSTPNEVPTGFSAVFKNNEIGELAKTLDDTLSRVRRFIDREKQFTRDASHELRTPVTVVKSALELLNTGSIQKDEMTQKLIQRIERSNRDMEATIESLLWLSRETSFGDTSSPEIDVGPIVEKAVRENRYLLTGKDVTIRFDAKERVLIPAPRGVLTIAISNLIRNACQYTTMGEVLVELANQRVVVSDTGIGIADEELQNIIAPGITGAKSDGFGFGLDIVQRVCDRFNWRLTIESQAGKGTKAILDFGDGPIEIEDY